MTDPDPTTTPAGVAAAEAASPGVTVGGVLSALPDFALAATFLITWVNPFAFGESAVQYCLLTMLLEFIIVHSSGFMGAAAFSGKDPGKRARDIVGLGLFYTLFVGGFALGFGTWWPLLAFWGLTLNRMLGVLIGNAPQGKERLYVRGDWALSAMYYLGGAFGTLFLPLPDLGLTREVRQVLDLPGGGVWIDEPHRVLAFGVLYFGLTGIGEVLGWARSAFILEGVPKGSE